MYRFATHEQWGEAEAAAERVERTSMGSASGGLPPTRSEAVLLALHRTRRAFSSYVSQYFESFVFAEKLLLVAALRLGSTPGFQALYQAVLYAAMTGLVLLVWPCQVRTVVCLSFSCQSKFLDFT